MKLNVKKLSILGLAGIFIISAMMCCCFSNVVEAEEPTPSCHQATQNTESSKSTEDCDCDQTIATAKKAVFLKHSLLQIATISLDTILSNHTYISFAVDAYQAPPSVYDTSPLYIKHSILRI